MKGPNFFVIGAAKCGTTSVCDLLGAHPDVFMSNPKEPHYFSRLTKQHELREWYGSLFEDADTHAAVGEGSTSYSHPHRIDFVVPRIVEEVPEARLVYMVRHPIRRLESDWKMRLRENRISKSIGEAVDRNASLVTFGLYWKQLTRYLDAFPEEQILVVFLEDFAENPSEELSRIYEHIGVDPTFVPEEPGRERNASQDYREDGTLASALRELPGFGALKGAVPHRTRAWIRNQLTREFDATPNWDRTELEAVRSYFRQDARNILDYCGKPVDYWKLAEDDQADEEPTT